MKKPIMKLKHGRSPVMQKGKPARSRMPAEAESRREDAGERGETPQTEDLASAFKRRRGY